MNYNFFDLFDLQKDATIRELTDRLMYGAEKFQEYLSTPSQQSVLYAMYKKKAWRTRSQPAVHSKERDNLRDYRLGRFYDNIDAISESSPTEARRPSFTVSQCSSDPTVDQPQPRSTELEAELSARSLLQNSPVYGSGTGTPNRALLTAPQVTPYERMRHDQRFAATRNREDHDHYQHHRRQNGHASITAPYYVNSAFQAPSPQHDSAIDNSPSSDLSDRGSDRAEIVRANSTPAHYRQRQTSCPIDLEAMERDGAAVAGSVNAKQARWSSVKTRRPANNGYSIAQIDYEPHRQKRMSGMSISQI